MSAGLVLGTRGCGVEPGPVAVMLGLSATFRISGMLQELGQSAVVAEGKHVALRWQHLLGTGTNSSAGKECRHGDQIWPPDRSPFRPRPSTRPSAHPSAHPLGGDVGPAPPDHPPAPQSP